MVTQEAIDALKEAIAKSVVLQSLTVGSTTYTFRNAADQIELLSWLQRQVNASAGTARPYRLAATSKGV